MCSLRHALKWLVGERINYNGNLNIQNTLIKRLHAIIVPSRQIHSLGNVHITKRTNIKTQFRKAREGTECVQERNTEDVEQTHKIESSASKSQQVESLKKLRRKSQKTQKWYKWKWF